MSNRNKNKKGLSLSGLKPYYIIIGFIIILLIALLMLIKNIGTEPEAVEHYETYIEAEPAIPETQKPPEKNPVTEYRQPAAPPEKPEPIEKPSVVFVIDDVGNSIEQLKPFLELPFPVTFAIMPDRKYTGECATMIASAGKEYILHQPMEALSGADPGKSAIYKSMTSVQISKTLENNFRQLPRAAGMNNHMGSAATSDTMVMNTVMDYLSENDKFFLDSFTISSSKGHEAASKFNVSYLKRNSMFLDNEHDHESIQNAVNEGKKTAKKSGHAVMIGHVMTQELADVMMDLYPDFIDEGFSLKEISELFIEMNALGAEDKQ